MNITIFLDVSLRKGRYKELYNMYSSPNVTRTTEPGETETVGAYKYMRNNKYVTKFLSDNLNG
jgi:hypothetical protein